MATVVDDNISAKAPPVAVAIPMPAVGIAPWLSSLCLMLGDVVTLAACAYVGVEVRHWMGGTLTLEWYLSLWPALLIFLAAFGVAGLYFRVLVSPPEELRRIVYTTTLVFLALGATTFITKQSEALSRGVYVVAWALAIVAVPLTRAFIRMLCARRSWWGYPTIVMGAGEAGHAVVDTLVDNPALGLKPVAVLESSTVSAQREIRGVPVVGEIEHASEWAKKLKVRYGIVARPEASREELAHIIEKQAHTFGELIIVPDMFGISSLWVSARDMDGILCLQITRRLLKPWNRFGKRAFEMFLMILGSPVLLLMGLIALAIRLDSRGPVFYSQERIGRNNRRFRAWKFRSMVMNADEKLKEYLAAHPELREEWEHTHKLKSDPRVTRVGKLLRLTSLDELPQLWNVLAGDMSLVGPRPIVEAEIEKYGDAFEIYLQVRPGLSGLWQVSGRSDTTYAERVHLDCYYVRNWSIWLDAYILARTVSVVLLGKGAY